MGESKLKRIRAEETLQSCTGLQTPAGKVQVRWESTSAATPMGRLAYFIEFLGLTGWEAHRRVVVLRRPLQGEILITQEDETGQQLQTGGT
jgi:hypothetical protein